MQTFNYTVYKHTAPNGKSYIGYTNNYERRCGEHRRSSYTKCSILSDAISKYGWDAFTHDIIATGLTLANALILEQYNIQVQNTLVPNGYNIKPGGSSGVNEKSIPAEVRERIRVSNTGKQRTVEAKQRMSDAKRGKKLKPFTDEHLRNMSKALKGRVFSDEHIQKLSTARCKRVISAETKQKTSNTLKGKPKSPETKARMKAAQLKRAAEHYVNKNR